MSMHNRKSNALADNVEVDYIISAELEHFIKPCWSVSTALRSAILHSHHFCSLICTSFH